MYSQKEKLCMSCIIQFEGQSLYSSFNFTSYAYWMSHGNYNSCTQSAVKVDSNKCDYLTSWTTSCLLKYKVIHSTSTCELTSGVTIPAVLLICKLVDSITSNESAGHFTRFIYHSRKQTKFLNKKQTRAQRKEQVFLQPLSPQTRDMQLLIVGMV